MGQRYVRSLVDAGGLPWLIPLLDDVELLRVIYDRLDGLYVVGGVDVDPSQYREARHALCGRTDPARDVAELRLARWAVAEGKPLFGVCRGLQLINVAAGGSLYQDVRAQHSGALKHDFFSTEERDTPIHRVRVAAGSRLAQILDAHEVV